MKNELQVTKKKNQLLEKMKKAKAIKRNDFSVNKSEFKPAYSRLVFSLDATASRSAAWETAKTITFDMFKSLPENLEVNLAYHGGNSLKLFSRFTQSHEEFHRDITSMYCEAGLTEFNAILEKSLETSRVKGIIYIGDCYEEDEAIAFSLAEKLRKKGTKLFIFHDETTVSSQTNHAKAIFSELVAICGGALLKFEPAAKKEFSDLINAIAVLTEGGVKQLESKKDGLPGAQLLLDKLT